METHVRVSQTYVELGPCKSFSLEALKLRGMRRCSHSKGKHNGEKYGSVMKVNHLCRALSSLAKKSDGLTGNHCETALTATESELCPL